MMTGRLSQEYSAQYQGIQIAVSLSCNFLEHVLCVSQHILKDSINDDIICRMPAILIRFLPDLGVIANVNDTVVELELFCGVIELVEVDISADSHCAVEWNTLALLFRGHRYFSFFLFLLCFFCLEHDS